MEESLILQQNKDLTIEQPVQEKKSTEHLLMQQEEGQILPLEEQRDRLFRSVTDSWKWCGDSDEMKEIKEEIGVIRKLQGPGDQADAAELFREYTWMIRLCENYLASRGREGSRYISRHALIRNLLRRMKQDRSALLVKDPDLAQNAYAAEHKSADQAVLRESECQANATALHNRLSRQMPSVKADFDKEKPKILALYDRIITHYRGEAKAICVFDSGKRKRAKAKRILHQLLKEREQIADLDFQASHAADRFQSWNALFKGRTKIMSVDNAYLKAHPEMSLTPAIQEDAYRIFSTLVGAEGIFSCEEKKVKYVDGTDETECCVRSEKDGITLEKAIEEAAKQRLPLMYSDQAIKKLVTAQLIDFIMGQTERTQESFRVHIKVKNVENLDYLVITDVSVIDHHQSLGIEKPDELNRTQPGKSTRRLLGSNGYLQLTGYDYRVADRILELDFNQVAAYFKTLGLEQRYLDSLKLRFDTMKQYLQKDRESGFRSHFEKPGKDPLSLSSKERKELRNFSHNTYILSSLIQDSGTEKGYKVAEIGKNEADDLKSGRKRLERGKRISKRIDRGKRGYAGSPIRKESDVVLNYVTKYLQTTLSAQFYTANRKDYKTLDWIFVFFEYDRVAPVKQRAVERLKNKNADPSNKDLLEQEVRQILTEEEGGVFQYLQRMRPKMLQNAKKYVQDRIDLINSKKPEDIDDYEREELENLQGILSDLADNDNPNGELQYARKDARVMGDRKLDRSLRFVSARDIPLFPSDPEVSDVVQGELGDCYFLAALGSVVEADPDFIMKHMKDNGNGTVTVKLYQPNAVLPGYSPLYITVDKTVAYKGEKLAGAQNCLWVQLYEKAFVLSGLKESRWFSEYQYQDITGGTGKEALGYITGAKSTRLFDFAKTVTGTRFSMRSSWKVKDPATGKTGYSLEFEYAVQTVKENLQALLAQGAVVTAGAYCMFHGAEEAAANGEKELRGLASRHEYSVIGMKEIGGKTYVRIRNPWGIGAVDTVMNELTGETFIRGADREKRQGSCLLEIHTFVEHIRNVDYVLKRNVRGMREDGAH